MTARQFFKAAATGAALVVSASAAQAAVLVDQTPTGTYNSFYNNIATGQNVLVKFVLGEATNLTGFDLLSFNATASVGQDVTVRIRSDVGGAPSSAGNLFEFTDTVDALTAFETSRSFANVDFAPVSLAAGTYWMGVSGTTTNLAWLAYDNGTGRRADDNYFMNGNNLTFNSFIHPLGYRIRGDVAVAGGVPEPGVWAMLILGFGAIGGALRKQRTTARVSFRIA